MAINLWHAAESAVKSNQFLSGGLALALMGGAVAYARKLPAALWRQTLARFTTVVDIAGGDPLYVWMQAWLADQPSSRRSGLISASSRAARADAGPSATGGVPKSPPRPDILFTPAPGSHWLWYRGRLVRSVRMRKERTDKDGNTSFSETLTLRFLSRDRDLARRLMAEARDHALPPEDRGVQVYAPHYEHWISMGRVGSRPMESVILPAGVAEHAAGRVEEFLASHARYESLGIPYHFGLLLHGPPGNGKTSFIRALAARFGFDVCLLSLQDDATAAARLRKLLAELPARPLLVLEDIDRDRVVSPGSGGIQVNVGNRLDLSSVLNALDGLLTPHGMIVVMTANRPEKLDPALRRPGRIDLEMEFTDATPDMAARLFSRFHPGEAGLAGEFAAAVGAMPDPVSMASLQVCLLRHRDSGRAAIDSLRGNVLETSGVVSQ